MTFPTGGKPSDTPAAVVQQDHKRYPDRTKPGAVSLTVDVTNMDEAGIADVQRSLEDVASKLNAEHGSGRCGVKSY